MNSSVTGTLVDISSPIYISIEARESLKNDWKSVVLLILYKTDKELLSW